MIQRQAFQRRGWRANGVVRVFVMGNVGNVYRRERKNTAKHFQLPFRSNGIMCIENNRKNERC